VILVFGFLNKDPFRRFGHGTTICGAERGASGTKAVRTNQHPGHQQTDDRRQSKSMKQMQNGACNEKDKYDASEQR